MLVAVKYVLKYAVRRQFPGHFQPVQQCSDKICPGSTGKWPIKFRVPGWAKFTRAKITPEQNGPGQKNLPRQKLHPGKMGPGTL